MDCDRLLAFSSPGSAAAQKIYELSGRLNLGAHSMPHLLLYALLDPGNLFFDKGDRVTPRDGWLSATSADS